MKTVSLSVVDFAVPVPRRGSIELHSGYARASAEGQEIHRAIQATRQEADPSYQPEVLVSRAFERGGYRFEISGRMDGLLGSDLPTIEEIKSAFNLRELKTKLQDRMHPYCLQLKTYGYFHFLEHKAVPKLWFHLVSIRTRSSESLEVALEVSEYEHWLELRLQELVLEATQSDARFARRQKNAKNIGFPFEVPRPGQPELVATIEKGMGEGARMLIQAPTGLGKTVGVLYPVLKEALHRGQKVIYVTPKNSQHSIAEDAVLRFQETGAKVRSLTVTAKSKICLKNEPLCNPEYCEYARDYYTKLHEYGLRAVMAKKRKLNRRVFLRLGEEYQVCPFELQFEAARDVEVVVCDYNYVFAPRAAFGKLETLAVGESGKPNLVIDEAHNLFARAQGYYSPELSTVTLERMRSSIRELPVTFRRDAEDLLEGCLAAIVACRPEGAERTTEIDPPVALFIDQDDALRGFLSRYLDSSIEIQPGDVVLRLCFYWAEFSAALGFVGVPKKPEFFTTFRPLGGEAAAVKITCCDASSQLAMAYDRFQQVVGFSATLKPFDYYAKLSGLSLEDLKVAEFRSPFPKEHRKLLIIREISTKYSERERNYRKIAEAIARISAVRPGNYFAFFPSFDFLERVLQVLEPPPGFVVLKQFKQMNAVEVEGVLEHLKGRGAPTLLFAVQGGVFSEGIDYPGESAIGVFVVGPPLPTFDLEREKMRAYYDEHYGSGFDYAYSFPAMAKAVQAAGRVIRSETDRGLIVLMDNRFLNASYAQSMPGDWYDESPTELISGAILKEVSEFWART